MDNRLIEIFLDLISIEGLPSQERDVADYVIGFLNGLNLKTFESSVIEASSNNCGNILCSIGSGGNFLIIAHMDTARSTKSVKPVISDDRITSDGSTVLGVDNRAGMACILYAIEKLIKDKNKLNDFTIAFTVQEETTLLGSMNLKAGNDIRMGFVFDSYLKPGNIICKAVGSAGFTIKVVGRAAHSGIAPEKGIDAIKITADAISKLTLGRIDDETTLNVGTIMGGESVNIVPELVQITGEVRSMDKQKMHEQLEKVKKEFELAATFKGGRVEFESYNYFEPFIIDSDNEVIKIAEASVRSVGLNPKLTFSLGGSDANSLNSNGITSINFGIGAANPHSNEEYILLQDLEKTAGVVSYLMKKHV